MLRFSALRDLCEQQLQRAVTVWRTWVCDAGVDDRPQQFGVTQFTDWYRPASSVHTSRLISWNSCRRQAHQPQVCRPHTSSAQRTETGQWATSGPSFTCNVHVSFVHASDAWLPIRRNCILAIVRCIFHLCWYRLPSSNNVAHLKTAYFTASHCCRCCSRDSNTIVDADPRSSSRQSQHVHRSVCWSGRSFCADGVLQSRQPARHTRQPVSQTRQHVHRLSRLWHTQGEPASKRLQLMIQQQTYRATLKSHFMPKGFSTSCHSS